MRISSAAPLGSWGWARTSKTNWLLKHPSLCPCFNTFIGVWGGVKLWLSQRVNIYLIFLSLKCKISWRLLTFIIFVLKLARRVAVFNSQFMARRFWVWIPWGPVTVLCSVRAPPVSTWVLSGYSCPPLWVPPPPHSPKTCLVLIGELLSLLNML